MKSSTLYQKTYRNVIIKLIRVLQNVAFKLKYTSVYE